MKVGAQFQGAGAYRWILERRNGLARGIYYRLVADDSFSGKQIFAEVARCLYALISGGRYSAYQLVFGSNPVDLLGWDDQYEDLLFAQDTSPSGQFVRQWKPRMMERVAAFEIVAGSKLRRLWA